ncbi:hypothetical protein D3C71_77760 [compost metagenome]
MNQDKKPNDVFLDAMLEVLKRYGGDETTATMKRFDDRSSGWTVAFFTTLDGQKVRRIAEIVFDVLEPTLARVVIEFKLELDEIAVVAVSPPRLIQTIIELDYNAISMIASACTEWCEQGLLPSEKLAFFARAPRTLWDGKYELVKATPQKK